MIRLIGLLALVGLLLTACGDDDTSDAGTETLSVADALDADGPVRVTGYLFVLNDDTVVLADRIAESFPPQPGGPTITVEGLNLDALDLEQAPADSGLATTQWTDNPVILTGSMRSDVLTGADLG